MSTGSIPVAVIAATLILAFPAADAVAGLPQTQPPSAESAPPATSRQLDHVQVAEAAPAATEAAASRPAPRRSVQVLAHRPGIGPGTGPGIGPDADAGSVYATARPHLTGLASYYAQQFNGRLMANGQRFDPHSDSIAHRTLPFGTRVRITNLTNGRSVYGTVRDRGPYARGRLLDVSPRIAGELGMLNSGLAPVAMWRAGAGPLEIAEAR